MLVDIAAPETFITSFECSYCYWRVPKYDSYLSSTSKTNSSRAWLHNGYLFFYGTVAQDTFTIGGVHILNQPFIQAVFVDGPTQSYQDLVAIPGIMGLTPSSAGSVTGNPSIFESLVMEKALNRNLFSLHLQEPSELVLGGVSPDIDTKKLVRIPLTNHTGPLALTGRWQAEVEYLSLGNAPGTRMLSSGYTAAFGTRSVFIGLPRPIVDYFHRQLKFERYLNLSESVACGQLASMPDLTFNLGGENFTLAPDEYTYRWSMPNNETRCMSAIQGFGGADSKEILLGTAFLRPFYSVFDLDTKTVGCKCKRFRYEQSRFG